MMEHDLYRDLTYEEFEDIINDDFDEFVDDDSIDFVDPEDIGEFIEESEGDDSTNESYIEELYHALLNDVRNKLCYPLLGKDYYNMGCDHLSCNHFMIEDIKSDYDLKMEFLKISLISNIVLVGLLVTSLILK